MNGRKYKWLINWGSFLYNWNYNPILITGGEPPGDPFILSLELRVDQRKMGFVFFWGRSLSGSVCPL